MYTYEYYNEALAPIDKPCAFLELDAFQHNVRLIERIAQHKRVRVASKSIRSIQVLKKIFSSSSVFQGIMCYSAEEAIYLTDHKFDDILVAYPIWNETVLRKICQRVKNSATITLMIDSMEHIKRLETIARQENGTFLVCIDMDVSTNFYGFHFGVHRSPLKNIEDIIDMIQRIRKSDFLFLDGIMGYEAQIAGIGDANPNQWIKNKMVRFLKKYSLKQLSLRREKIATYLEQEGIEIRFTNGGGTGSIHQTVNDPFVTEITVGSGFYNPHLFDVYKDIRFEVAAGFAVEITRIPKTTIYTCLGGGYVASGAAGKDRLPEILYPKGAKLTVNEGVGEVQTPIIYHGPLPLQHGDSILFRHSKAGELCERFQYLHIIENGKVKDKITTYRGDGKCFL